ncbi:LysR substrate-binding domain-containing protein [Aquabacterium sp.]|uniref:LysR substrate-binding domain-containing protein n=1 Tax=Aquabacterium sp. TaxID=1872578 RepID=UPI0037842CB8
MDLESLRIFAKVAELASFSRAAEQLALPKARVSTAVQQLEARVGTQLLHRTTRVVRLTEDGRQFVERCRQLLVDAEQLQSMFTHNPAALRGRLRIDLPTVLARDTIVPRLPGFLAAHPLLELGLSTTDRLVDVVHEGFDCVLRVGALGDSDLVARRLGQLRVINCASPAYLHAQGTPRTLAELDAHRLVHYAGSLSTASAGWEYHDGQRYRVKPMRCTVAVNGTDAFQAACVAGLGLIQVPATGVRGRLQRGELVEVLPQHTAEPLPVSLLYPQRRHLPRRVQVFMAWLTQVLQPYLAEA